MRDIHAGYAIKVKQRDTGKTGYLWGNEFGKTQYSYLTLVEDPKAFFANPPDYVLSTLKRHNLEIEEMVGVKAVVMEKTVTREELEHREKLETAIDAMRKQTVVDVMGHDAVHLLRDEIRKGLDLGEHFRAAAAGHPDFDTMEHLGTVILGDNGTIVLAHDTYLKDDRAIETSLKWAVLHKKFTSTWNQNANLMRIASRLFRTGEAKSDLKIGGVFVKICEDDPYNINKTQMAYMIRQLGEKQGIIAASVTPEPAPEKSRPQQYHRSL